MSRVDFRIHTTKRSSCPFIFKITNASETLLHLPPSPLSNRSASRVIKKGRPQQHCDPQLIWLCFTQRLWSDRGDVYNLTRHWSLVSGFCVEPLSPLPHVSV